MSARYRFPEVVHFEHRFTTSTGGRLERSFVRAMRGPRGSSVMSLRNAVGDATRELQAAGLADDAVLDVLGALVEDTGRACGADRLSLISGELQWLPVRVHVLKLASAALQAMCLIVNPSISSPESPEHPRGAPVNSEPRLR